MINFTSSKTPNTGNVHLPGSKEYEATLRAIRQKPKRRTPTQEPTPTEPREETQTQAPTSYVYIPTINLSFAPEITLQGKNWYDAHREIIANPENGRMPRTSETWAAIFYARENLQEEGMQHLYNSILKTIQPGWHGEHQNDFFTEEEGKMYVQHLEDFNSDEEPIFSKRTEIAGYLTQNGWADISSKTHLTEEGLCKKLSKQDSYSQGENIYFWTPIDQRVASFIAYPAEVSLECNSSPSDPGANLGVRLCIKGKPTGDQK